MAEIRSIVNELIEEVKNRNPISHDGWLNNSTRQSRKWSLASIQERDSLNLILILPVRYEL